MTETSLDQRTAGSRRRRAVSIWSFILVSSASNAFDLIMQVALYWSIWETTRSVPTLCACALGASAAVAALARISGTLVSRFDPRACLIITDILRLAYFLVLSTHLGEWIACGVLLILESALSTTFSLARSTVLSVQANRSSVMPYARAFAKTRTVTQIIGLAALAVVGTRVDLGTLVRLNAATFITSSAVLLGLLKVTPLRRRTLPSPRGDLRPGADALPPSLRGMVAFCLVAAVCTAPLYSLLPVVLVDRGHASLSHLAIIRMAQLLGLLAGGALLVRIPPRSAPSVLALGPAALGGGYLLILIHGSLLALAGCAAAVGVALSLINRDAIGIVQATVPAAKRTTAFAKLTKLESAGESLGLLALGFTASMTALNVVVDGAAVTLAGFIGLRHLANRIRGGNLRARQEYP